MQPDLMSIVGVYFFLFAIALMFVSGIYTLWKLAPKEEPMFNRHPVIYVRHGHLTPEGFALIALGAIIGAGISISLYGLYKLGLLL